MAQFMMEIPNEILDEVQDAFEHSYPIPLDVEGAPTMTPAANAKKALRQFIRDIHKAFKATTSAEAARVAAADAAEIASAGIEVT